MLRAAIIISALAISFAAVDPKDSVPHLDGRIIGGSAASIYNYPWQVSLQYYGSHFCGGSIYSHNIVITAAHCVENSNVAYIQVRAGSSNSSSGGVVLNAVAYKIHEEYNYYTLENDIAVIRLNSSLPFGSAITNIRLAEKAPAHGASAVVTGWGVTSSGYLTSALQYVNVNIVGESVCASKLYKYGDSVSSSMICAAADGKDACQGDSGGPLVSGGVLVGIVSWGYGCALPDYPGVYSCVTALRSWVLDTVSKI